MIDREDGMFMAKDRVEVKSGAEVLDLSVEEFARKVLDGKIHPETFIKSPLTGYRWRHAADTELYQSFLERSEFQVVDRRGPSHSFVDGNAPGGGAVAPRRVNVVRVLAILIVVALVIYWFFW